MFITELYFPIFIMLNYIVVTEHLLVEPVDACVAYNCLYENPPEEKHRETIAFPILPEESFFSYWSIVLEGK